MSVWVVFHLSLRYSSAPLCLCATPPRLSVFALLLYASANHNIFDFIYVKLKIKTTCRYEFSVGMQACAPVMICNVAQAVM